MSARRAFGGIRRLPSKHYQASYTGPDGRRHLGHSTYLVKADAEHWLREEELLIDQGGWTPPARRRPVAIVDAVTVAEWSETVIRRRAARSRKPIRPSTVDLYRKLLRLTILPTLGTTPLVDLTATDVSRWYDSLPADQPTQAGNAYQLLRSILAEAVEDEIIDRNPCRVRGAGKPAPRHQPESLTIGEIQLYWLGLPEWARMPLILAAWCGLRSGEVRALRVGDIAPDGTALRISRTVTRTTGPDGYEWRYGPPKTAAGVRTVAVPPHLAPVLAAHLAGLAPDALAFPASDGRTPIHTSTLHEAHKRAARGIGRDTLMIHDLRRTGATLAAQTGATTKELMRMLGHTQPGVAMLYQVADDQRDVERAARMSALLA